MTTAIEASDDRKTRGVAIFIDGKSYEAPKKEMTGAEIRGLAKPPVGPDRDLWLEGPKGLDKLVGDNELVHLVPDTRFFTVPKVINPGGQ